MSFQALVNSILSPFDCSKTRAQDGLTFLFSIFIFQFLRQLKLRISESTIKYQPSVSTKMSTLNGSDTSTGGRNIIPIESRTDDTTRSITKNGR